MSEYSPLAVPSTPHNSPARQALTSRRNGLFVLNGGHEPMRSAVGRWEGFIPIEGSRDVRIGWQDHDHSRATVPSR